MPRTTSSTTFQGHEFLFPRADLKNDLGYAPPDDHARSATALRGGRRLLGQNAASGPRPSSLLLTAALVVTASRQAVGAASARRRLCHPLVLSRPAGLYVGVIIGGLIGGAAGAAAGAARPTTVRSSPSSGAVRCQSGQCRGRQCRRQALGESAWATMSRCSANMSTTAIIGLARVSPADGRHQGRRWLRRRRQTLRSDGSPIFPIPARCRRSRRARDRSDAPGHARRTGQRRVQEALRKSRQSLVHDAQSRHSTRRRARNSNRSNSAGPSIRWSTADSGWRFSTAALSGGRDPLCCRGVLGGFRQEGPGIVGERAPAFDAEAVFRRAQQHDLDLAQDGARAGADRKGRRATGPAGSPH